MNTAPERDHRPGRGIGDRLRELTGEIDGYVDAVARSLGLHRTDVTAIGTLMSAWRRGEALTPGELSRRTRLSAAAATALVDRLERVGHATRAPHDSDRRHVVVRLTDTARRASRTMFGPLNRSYAQTLAGYTSEELALVERVLDDLIEATRRASVADADEEDATVDPV